MPVSSSASPERGWWTGARDRLLHLECWLALLTVRARCGAGLVGARDLAPASIHHARARSGDVARIEEAFRAAEACIPGAVTCLVRAVALRAVLRRRGVEASLRVGVRRGAGDGPSGAGLDAHAWLEWEGRILGDEPEHCATFVPLERRPPAERRTPATPGPPSRRALRGRSPGGREEPWG